MCCLSIQFHSISFRVECFFCGSPSPFQKKCLLKWFWNLFFLKDSWNYRDGNYALKAACERGLIVVNQVTKNILTRIQKFEWLNFPTSPNLMMIFITCERGIFISTNNLKTSLSNWIEWNDEWGSKIYRK